VEIFSEKLDMNLKVIIVDGPYVGQVLFWESLLNKSCMQLKDIILGGDLNFSLGAVEIWGPKALSDPLGIFSLLS